MADVKKQEKDYTKEVDQLIPEAESIAQVSFIVETRSCLLIKDRTRRLGRSSRSRESFRKVWTNYSRWRSKHEMYAFIRSDFCVRWIET